MAAASGITGRSSATKHVALLSDPYSPCLTMTTGIARTAVTKQHSNVVFQLHPCHLMQEFPAPITIFNEVLPC